MPSLRELALMKATSPESNCFNVLADVVDETVGNLTAAIAALDGRVRALESSARDREALEEKQAEASTP